VEHGAFHYLVKPVSLATLENAISQAAEARLQQQMAMVLLNSQPPPSQVSNIDLADSFTRALHSLWLAFQPIVHAGSNHPFGYEVLLRSDEPSLPDPSRVLDAAEQLGRLPDIGRFVRTRAAAVLRSRPPSVCLFVNVHTEDLLDPLLLQEESPLTRVADRVVLEITERASIERVDNLQERVAQLREFGYRIALDDMGAGYANLNTLALLEPEIVKLDMSLVRGLHLNKTKQKLVRSIIQLCRDMDMLVVGEGVESVEEQDALVSLGCDLLQGFLFSTPERTLPRSDAPPQSDD
jgi:EAL domain-containing protein (putative c-di-GMP-specific phosphodiesterase class I)